MRHWYAATIGLLCCAGAAAETPVDGALKTYTATLAAECPAKRLDLLSPADLRDALDSYKGTLPPQQGERMDAAERALCKSGASGATCANTADIEVAGQLGAMPDLADEVCNSFAKCTAQSDCDNGR